MFKTKLAKMSYTNSESYSIGDSVCLVKFRVKLIAVNP